MGARLTITYSVPSVVNVAGITDTVARNHAINQSYHAFDVAMTTYLGNPLISNWMTYGKHASREAGNQINNLKAGLQVLKDAQPILKGLAAPTNLAQAPIIARKIGPTLRRISALMAAPGLMKQSLKLALKKAGITQGELNKFAAAAKESATFELSDLNPFVKLYEDGETAARAIALGVKLAAALPAIIRAVQKVYNNMCKGNLQIYQNVAPAFRDFLQAGLRSPNGVVDVSKLRFAGDKRGFIRAAFVNYSQARALTNQIATGKGNIAQLKQQRSALVHEANLLLGFQEQLLILQPLFDTMKEELRAMDGTIVLNDPNGRHPMTNNWGDFYSRMGLSPSGAPTNPMNIQRTALPKVIAGKTGTISHYFLKNLHDRAIHAAPPPIRNH